MRDGGRAAAAIGVVEAVLEEGRPVRRALEDWGRTARYAGAQDRAAVSGLALDVLRRRRSLAWIAAGEEAASAEVLVAAALSQMWAWPAERIAQAWADPHGPPGEAPAMAGPALADAPAAVRGDYPDWLDAPLARAFGKDRAAEGAALAERAPVDLRVNTLKCDPARALKAVGPLGARPFGPLPTSLRIDPPAAAERAAPVEALPEFERGWFEVQDLGSQIAAACAAPARGAQVLDFCAGGGGKTLALAAAMANTGQIFAYDSDARRLKETVPRAQRAGVRNLQVRTPLRPQPLDDLVGRMDLVLVDAPCTGTGTWRRHPDAKWRLGPAQLARRMEEQDAILDAALPYVRPGGRLVYITCSLLAEENEDRIAAALARTPQMAPAPLTPPGDLPLTAEGFLRLSPRRFGSDGFFVAALQRA